MKECVFRGIATAMVTPMTGTGVDYEALGRFIEFQIDSGVNALVAVGIMYFKKKKGDDGE